MCFSAKDAAFYDHEPGSAHSSVPAFTAAHRDALFQIPSEYSAYGAAPLSFNLITWTSAVKRVPIIFPEMSLKFTAKAMDTSHDPV
jgi:hypothetical protein